MYDLEMIKENGFVAPENYSRHLTLANRRARRRRRCSIISHKDTPIVIDESHQTVSQIGAMYAAYLVPEKQLGRIRFSVLPSAMITAR